MPANAFDLFMEQHPPVGALVGAANTVLWDQSALNLVVKERMRIALAEELGCSYCIRFRTDLDGEPVLGAADDLTPEDQRKAVLAEAFARAVVAGDAGDEATVAIQQEFTPEEFTDLIFSIGWFVGMQHVGRLMHWDDSCPVAPIRKLVEAGEAA
jgi:alkylhydroperoxidase family enzyme